jgi:Protein of unknown function (DUF2474)
LSDGDEIRPLWQRLAWFAALWIASVAVLGVIAYALRKVLLG